jgi:hypothetical protein
MSLDDAMDDLMNLHRAEMGRSIDDRIAHPRQGRVTGYNPATPHLVKVLILPEGDFPLGPGQNFETDWIQYPPVAAGAGWGIYAPPFIGDQVTLNFQEHDRDAPIVVARHNDADHLPPGSIQSGEIVMVNNFGVTVHMKPDGSLYSTAPGGTGYTFVGNGTLQGNWLVTGTLTVAEILTAEAGISATGAEGVIIATGDVIAGYGSTNASGLHHVHSGVVTGGGDTGPPVPLAGAMRRRAQGRMLAMKRKAP